MSRALRSARWAGLLALCALLGLAFAPRAADAARWHPKHRWQSLRTPNFTIHFHEGEGPLAIETARIAEEVHAILAPYLQWQPLEPTQVVLIDTTDTANGYATPLPYNTIVMYMVQPTPDSSLDNHQHWLWSLFVHEYTHTLQIDMVDGLPAAARFLLGRTSVPNGVMPRWMTEGYATMMETYWTAGGRGRSTYTDQLLRTAALAGKLPRIDTADGFGHRWPGGQLRYLYGVRFHFHVAEKAGDRAWVDFHRRHARGIIPLILPAREAFGRTVARMWAEWREELAAHYLAEAERLRREGRGVTAARALPTKSGFARAPRYTADGQSIVYAHSSPYGPSSLRRIDRDGTDDRRVRLTSGRDASWDADRRLLYWSTSASANRWENFQDLYRWRVGRSGARRLTHGERLRWPAPHPEGWLLAVRTELAGSSLVRVDLPDYGAGSDDTDPDDLGQEGTTRASGAEPGGLELDGGRAPGLVPIVTPLTAAEDGTHYASPVWDPTGERLAVSVWKPGGFRDIHVFDRSLRQLRALSWDRAGDTDPVWSPDGRWLVWSSDRDDISNLYAYRWEDGEVRRLTRVLGGASRPDISPDGRWLAFESYTADGPLIEEIPFDPEGAEPYAIPVRALPGPDFGPSAQALSPLHPLEGVPGPELPFARGPDEAVARARARPDYRTLAPGARDALALPGPQDPAEADEEPDEEPEGAAPEAELAPEERAARKAKEKAADAAKKARARERRRLLRLRTAERNRRAPKQALLEVPEELGTVRRYNPLPTLFPPRYLSPYGAITEAGALGGLAIGGQDVLGHHAWSAAVDYRTDTRFVGGSVGYWFRQFRPTISVGYSAFSVDYGSMFLTSKEAPPPGGTSFAGVYRAEERYQERRDRARAGISIPVGLRHALSASYRFEYRQPIRPLPDRIAADLIPARGSFAGIELGWAYGRFGRWSAGISPEDSELVSFSLDLESSFLGAFRVEPDGSRSELHRLILTGEARKYITLPWFRNHVLALRAAGGATIGTELPQRTFRIGGPFGDNAYTSLPDRYYGLRGYPTSFQRGDHLLLATVEYRLPLLLLERGFWTLPVWLRSVSLTVFAEAGQAFDTADYAPYRGSPEGFLAFWGSTRVAVGAELVGDAVLAWGGYFEARLGYGFGIGAGAYPAGTFYAQLGTSF